MHFEHPSFNDLEEAKKGTSKDIFKILQILPNGRVFTSIAVFDDDKEIKEGWENPQQIREQIGKLLHIIHVKSLLHEMMGYLFEEGEGKKENDPKFIKDWFDALTLGLTKRESGGLVHVGETPSYDPSEYDSPELEEVKSEADIFLLKNCDVLKPLTDQSLFLLDDFQDLILEVYNMGIHEGWYRYKDLMDLQGLYLASTSNEEEWDLVSNSYSL